jgi:hypothetical protein
VTLPDLSGSGKRGNPCERMQAEYAVGLAEPEPLDEPEPLVPLVVSACATFGLDEPPQAAANRLSTVAAASASAIRAIRFLIRGRFLRLRHVRAGAEAAALTMTPGQSRSGSPAATCGTPSEQP